jgi:mRNA-degrading endonuclease HigB of HigAB toxin-antitoxin module
MDVTKAYPSIESNILLGRLYEIRTRFRKEETAEKKSILLLLSQKDHFNRNQIKRYFDLLLFIKAYPDDKVIFSFAANELRRVSFILFSDKKLAESLRDSGISNTNVSGIFSFELIKWLRFQFNQNVKTISIGADERKSISILTCLLGEVPTEILQEGYIKWKIWIKKFATTNKEDILDILIKVFDQSSLSSRLKEELWNDMQIVVSIALNDDILTRGSEVSFSGPQYCHKRINKTPDVKYILDQKPITVALNDGQKEEIISLSRMALVCYQRETDPVTYSCVDFCRYYSLKNGLSVTLLGMQPDRRQPVDTYIGYMAFKNGTPIAYGGGWILFESCRIGINVFPSFRGGESSLIFAQILGLYKHVFSINRFTVDPYQIGKNNSDGIKSAAFWMYYRLGFRPTKAELQEMANRESIKIQTTKSYRTATKTLTELANSKLEYIVSKKDSTIFFDATDLSILYQNIIKRDFSGNLTNAHLGYKKDRRSNQNALSVKNRIAENWFRILGLNDSWKNYISEVSLDELFLLKAKGDEYDYIKLLHKKVKLKNFFVKCLSNYENTD